MRAYLQVALEQDISDHRIGRRPGNRLNASGSDFPTFTGLPRELLEQRCSRRAAGDVRRADEQYAAQVRSFFSAQVSMNPLI